MAYIPPHKRHPTEANPPPTPAPPPFQTPRKGNPKPRPPQGGGKVLYSRESISRWFVAPCSGDQLGCSVRLNEFVVDSTEMKDGKKHMIVERVGGKREVNEDVNCTVKSPWVSVTEKIQQDLLTSFQIAREDMSKEGPELIVPRFVIRFGKILFNGRAFDFLDNYNKSSAVEDILRPLRKRYYTNIPNSFREAVLGQIITKVGGEFVEEKEHYLVKVLDKSRSDVTISCKCSVEAGGKLHLYKIELNEIRQMVVDISCLEKDLDLRLLLSAKRILTSPTDDAKDAMNTLVNSALMDSEVKGGLRWPLGKKSVGDRYEVVGVWHTISKVYKNSFMRLKMRHADRFDFRNSTGDVAEEVSLRIPELTTRLRDTSMELSPLIDTVRDGLKFVWENFLSWEGSFTETLALDHLSLS